MFREFSDDDGVQNLLDDNLEQEEPEEIDDDDTERQQQEEMYTRNKWLGCVDHKLANLVKSTLQRDERTRALLRR